MRGTGLCRATARGDCDQAGRAVQRLEAFADSRASGRVGRRFADGNLKAAPAREFGISRDTLYRYVPAKCAGPGSSKVKRMQGIGGGKR
jgi:DNA invertase Pin-like site-specific DNA recombinase